MNEPTKRHSFFGVCETLLILLCVLILFCSSTFLFAGKVVTEYFYPRHYRDIVEEYAAQYNVEANMIYAIIKAESGFTASAVSQAGAIGLMQIVPDTFLFDIRSHIGMADAASSALFDARTNIHAGVYYFSYLFNYFNSSVESIASYNAGIGTVKSWLVDPALSTDEGLIIENIPYAETRAYVERVLDYKAKYDLVYGKKDRIEDSTVSEAQCYRWAKKYGEMYRIDPRFVMAIVKTESDFRYGITSISGAVGLMQIMKNTYDEDIKANLKLEENFKDLYDPEFNIRCGTYYLHWLDERFEGYEQIAAAYNGGIGNVRKWLTDPAYSEDGQTLILENIPLDQTRRYVQKVMNNYAAYCEIYPE